MSDLGMRTASKLLLFAAVMNASIVATVTAAQSSTARHCFGVRRGTGNQGVVKQEVSHSWLSLLPRPFPQSAANIWRKSQFPT